MTLIRQVSAPGSDIMWHNDTSLEKDKMLLCHLDVLYPSPGSGIFCKSAKCSFIFRMDRLGTNRAILSIISNFVSDTLQCLTILKYCCHKYCCHEYCCHKDRSCWFWVRKLENGFCVKYFPALCPRSGADQITNLIGRIRWQQPAQYRVSDQFICAMSCFRSIYLHNIIFWTNLFAQYHVSNRYLLRQDSSAQELF